MAKRVASQRTWEVMGTQVLVSLMEEGDSDVGQEDFDPNKTVIIDGIPGEMADKHLSDILCLSTGVDEGKFTVQRRGSRALFRLVGKYKQGEYKYMYIYYIGYISMWQAGQLVCGWADVYVCKCVKYT